MFYCECRLNDGSIELAFNEVSPCSSGTHCGSCPSGSFPTEMAYQCPVEEEPTTGSYSCSGWDPDSLIYTVQTNSYAVDTGLVSAVENDVTPLYECDSARINVESGHLMVEDAISTDMVYLLGLRNGDRLVEVNSMSIDDPILAAVAYTTLWQDQAETEYTLKVLRNNSYVYIDYELVAMKP